MKEESRTKTALSEKDIKNLVDEVDDLSVHMCTIAYHISTPRIERGCNMSKDLADEIKTLIPGQADANTIKNIRAMLDDISDIAVGVEVGIEDILIPTRKTKKHFHKARKIITNPVP